MSKPLSFVALASTLALFAAGCESKPTEGQPLGPCTGLVVPALVSASGTFTWTPGCAIQEVVVVQAPTAGGGPGACAINNGGIAWHVRANPTLITPPVAYGTAPGGTEVVTTACAAVPGLDYTIQLIAPGSSLPAGTLSWRP